MRIGCCIPGGSFMPQEHEGEMGALERLTRGSRILREKGFDFAESALGTVMDLTEDELSRAADSDLRLEACNCFIPGEGTIMRGSEDLADYVRESMRRMRRLGCGLVVFGSGRARSIPEGMSRREGMARIRAFLTLCQQAGEEYGVDVLIEPLNRMESNVVNRVSQAAELAREMNLSHVAVLADVYHMAREGEPLSAMAEAGSLVRHVHVSESDRSRPGVTDDLRAVAQALRDMRYAHRVSVECVFTDFGREIGPTAEFMKEVFA